MRMNWQIDKNAMAKQLKMVRINTKRINNIIYTKQNSECECEAQNSKKKIKRETKKLQDKCSCANTHTHMQRGTDEKRIQQDQTILIFPRLLMCQNTASQIHN